MKYTCIVFVLFITIVSCESQNLKRRVFQKGVMYTSFDILMYSKSPKYKLNNSVNKIWDRLEYLEKELSPAGEGFLGKLNQDSFVLESENPGIFSVLSNFIVLSKTINEKSEGMFDLTVYPLVRLWGFYLQDEEKRVPSNQEIKQALQFMGMDNIIFTNNGIQLLNDVKIDVGAIAKGYAVDEAVRMMQELEGVSAGFVNAGGNIRVYGTKPDGTPWRVGIRNPNGENIEEIISLYDGESIATSGDYEQFFIVDNQYYHHIFNPKTGRPVAHNLASLSIVLKGSAELADVLATAFLALGTEKTKELLPIFEKDQQFSLFFIERNGKELNSEATKLWKDRQ